MLPETSQIPTLGSSEAYLMQQQKNKKLLQSPPPTHSPAEINTDHDLMKNIFNKYLWRSTSYSLHLIDEQKAENFLEQSYAKRRDGGHNLCSSA